MFFFTQFRPKLPYLVHYKCFHCLIHNYKITHIKYDFFYSFRQISDFNYSIVKIKNIYVKTAHLTQKHIYNMY